MSTDLKLKATVSFTGLDIEPSALAEFRRIGGPIPRDWSRQTLHIGRGSPHGYLRRLERWLERRMTGRWAICPTLYGISIEIVIAFENLSDAVMFKFDHGTEEWLTSERR